MKDLQNKINTFKNAKDHYHAIKLDDGSREKLLSAIGPKYSNVHAHHITLNFKPNNEDEKVFDNLEGTPVTFDVTHHASDDKIGAQAVRVSGLGDWHSKKPHMHITISTAPHGKPVKSNDLLAGTEGESIKPLKLTGTFQRLKK